jgi:hypothetical protein
MGGPPGWGEGEIEAGGETGRFEGEGGASGEVTPGGEPGGAGERVGGGDLERGTDGANRGRRRGCGEAGGEGAVADDAEGEFGLGGCPGGGGGGMVPHDQAGLGKGGESAVKAAALEQAGVIFDEEGPEGVESGFEGDAEVGGGFLEGGVIRGGGGEDVEMEAGGAETGRGFIVEHMMDALAQGDQREIERIDWPPRYTLGSSSHPRKVQPLS